MLMKAMHVLLLVTASLIYLFKYRHIINILKNFKMSSQVYVIWMVVFYIGGASFGLYFILCVFVKSISTR